MRFPWKKAELGNVVIRIGRSKLFFMIVTMKWIFATFDAGCAAWVASFYLGVFIS